MKIKGFLKDISGFFKIIKNRKKAIKKANNEIPFDNISDVARKLHPGKIKAIVKNIKQEKNDSVRITLSSKSIPLFRAGTYLTIELNIGSSLITRGYSIVSDPLTAYKNKEVEIIVKNDPKGFASKYLNNDLKIGDEVIIEVGLGESYLDKFRDKKNIVLIAGGVGITPFLSIAHDVVNRDLDFNVTILYGNENENDIIAKEELESLSSPKLKIIHVINDDNYKGEKGFINKDIISKYSDINNSTYFVCGVEAMVRHILKELESLGVDLRKVRHDPIPKNDISDILDKEALNKIYNIEVHQGINVTKIKAKASESIAVALERSGLRVHICCRGGVCGACRIKVIDGSYYINKDNNHRRYTDKEFNYVYACATYPTSDMIIKIDI